MSFCKPCHKHFTWRSPGPPGNNMRPCHPASHASAPQCNTGNWKQKAVPQSLDEDFLLHRIFPARPIRSWEQRFKRAHWILVCGTPHLPEKPNSAATCAFHGSNGVKTFASHSRSHQTYSPTAISLGRKLCLHFIVGISLCQTRKKNSRKMHPRKNATQTLCYIVVAAVRTALGLTSCCRYENSSPSGIQMNGLLSCQKAWNVCANNAWTSSVRQDGQQNQNIPTHVHFVIFCQPPPPGSVPLVRKMFEWLVPNVTLEKNYAPKNWSTFHRKKFVAGNKPKKCEKHAAGNVPPKPKQPPHDKAFACNAIRSSAFPTWLCTTQRPNQGFAEHVCEETMQQKQQRRAISVHSLYTQTPPLAHGVWNVPIHHASAGTHARKKANFMPSKCQIGDVRHAAESVVTVAYAWPPKINKASCVQHVHIHHVSVVAVLVQTAKNTMQPLCQAGHVPHVSWNLVVSVDSL